MDKAASLHVADSASKEHAGSKFDELTEVVSLARSNGWDLKRLNLITKILPEEAPEDLTDEQVSRRNHLVRSVIKRFDQVLTPPVPPEVEQYIRLKDPCDWLPWEEEVIAKVGRWRTQLETIAPELMEDLYQAVRAIQNS